MEQGLQIGLTSFFDIYAEAVLIASKTGKILYCNAAFVKLSGYEFSEIADIRINNLFNVRVNLYHSNDFKTAHWDSNFSRKNQTNTWLRVSETQYSDSSGQDLLVYTVFDNQTMDQLNGLLKESETRFVTLADSSPVMLWMTDPDNLSYYFNKSWLEFTGKKLEEEIGSGWLKAVHPEDLRVFGKPEFVKQLDNREKYSTEYRLMRHDGEYRVLLEIGTPRFLPDGSFAGYMGSCLDITEIKKAQTELANQTQELIRSNEELEQFAYVASHDLQEPLRMVNSYIQLINRGIQSGNTNNLDEFMQFVLDGVSRMQALINDLLQYSRVNRKGNPFTAVNMNDLMNIIRINLSQKLKESDAILNVPELPSINGDFIQLQRLVQNLCENALKFKSENKPVIDVTVEEREQEWLFAVRDNGIGIESKFYNRIFVIFQRLHTRDQYEGTGIGLAVCKKIVERHGGEIWVESEYGNGSTFYFTIKKQ